jgi:putative addiction module killer protein
VSDIYDILSCQWNKEGKMDSEPWQIEKYVLNSGSCPFDDWFNSLSPQDQALVDTRIIRVSLGNFGDTNSLGDGVFELKFKTGTGWRIYYGRSGKCVILLLCAGNKRSQKRDVTTAKNYWGFFQKEK